jgi:subtilase family serine protease
MKRRQNTSSSLGNHYLAPDDFATIFNLTPLYNSGINGSGQKIVIVGQSKIDTTHPSTFTSYFGMNSVSLPDRARTEQTEPG